MAEGTLVDHESLTLCDLRCWCEAQSAVLALCGFGGISGALLDIVHPAVGDYTAPVELIVHFVGSLPSSPISFPRYQPRGVSS